MGTAVCGGTTEGHLVYTLEIGEVKSSRVFLPPYFTDQTTVQEQSEAHL